MTMGFLFMADNSPEVCARCAGSEWPRIGLQIEGRPNIYICAHCLAEAIEAATGWKIKALLDRYQKVSPLFDNPATDWGMLKDEHKKHARKTAEIHSKPISRKR